MRWSWLRAVVLGFIIGPVPLAAEPSEGGEAESFEAEEASSAEPAGHVFAGANFYVWDEDSRHAEQWADELLRAGGEPAEAARRRALAERSAALPTILTEEDEIELSTWIGSASEGSRTPPLGLLLCLLPSLDRTCLITSWATSPDEQTRRSLARSLGAPFEAIGVNAALEHLQDDPSPEVRRLARVAAAARLASPGLNDVSGNHT